MNFFKSLIKKILPPDEEEQIKGSTIPYTNTPIEKNEDLAMLFAEKFTQNKGKFFFCANQDELQENLHNVFKYEQIKIVYTRENKVFDLLTNFDIGFTELPEDASDATILYADYIDGKTGKVYVSREKKELLQLESTSDMVIIIAEEKQLFSKFINLYNDYYSIQNKNKYTTFSVYKKNIILLLIETPKK
ncbi:MAG: hypothetical protein H6604_08440 [Flavobacteriales bacterium]|nr:hypothetical protein [Flavobacteriales bacterium]